MSDLFRVCAALSDTSDPDGMDFYSEDELSLADINVGVEGLGELNFPLTEECILKLGEISSKFQCDDKSSTSDTEICHSQEIPSHKLSVKINKSVLTNMLNKIQQGLKLDANTTITPHLHNMVFYRPEQVLCPPTKNVIAYLVIILPSFNSDGTLVIKRGRENYEFSSEQLKSNHAKCVASYTDYENKITDGHFIALTYHLTLSQELHNPKHRNEKLKVAISKYFVKPSRLIYFLDHKYTEDSLNWGMLKGSDHVNAAAMCLIAKELGVVSHLALIEMEPSSMHDSDEPDKFLNLAYCVDENGKEVQPKNYFGEYSTVKANGLCFTKCMDFFEPMLCNDLLDSDSDENDGKELPERYKCAAIILWSSKILMNFALDYKNAVDELHVLVKTPGNEERLFELVENAGRSLYRNTSSFSSSVDDFKLFVAVACYMKNKKRALTILSPFDWELLNKDIVEQLVELQTKYGSSWCIELFQTWKRNMSDRCHSNLYDFDNPMNGVDYVISKFLENGVETKVVQYLLGVHTGYLISEDKRIVGGRICGKRACDQAIKEVHQILVTCAKLQDTAVISSIIGHVLSHPEQYPQSDFINLLESLQSDIAPDYYNQVNIHLHFFLTKELLHLHKMQEKSVECQLPCRCKHCKTSMKFLQSKTDRSKTWYLREADCKHIVQMLKQHKLPVNWNVEKTFKSNKITLTKEKRIASSEESMQRLSSLKEFHQQLMDRKVV